MAKLRALSHHKAAIGEERLRPVPRLLASVITKPPGAVAAVDTRLDDAEPAGAPAHDRRPDHPDADDGRDGTPCCRFTVRTRFDRLFVGLGEVRSKDRPGFIAPGDVEGTERIGPNDYSGEEEYHRLLERAYERGAERGGAPGGT
ncbi:MAG TPA: hypothetical protein VHD57_08000 [Vicinamibacterales bacterium]|nr:hypothetical protein [Vicinamibacterales bacterium]